MNCKINMKTNTHTNKSNEILLVEDNATDAELAIRALRKISSASNITWLKDGAEALDYIFHNGEYAERSSRHYPSVILLDLKLPKIDGIEVLKKIKADEQSRHIPVVVLSSSNEEKDIVNSYRYGANSYIVKSVEFAAFNEAVSQVGVYWMELNTPPNNRDK